MAGEKAALTSVFDRAIERVVGGKGAERHGGEDMLFMQQPLFTIPKHLCSDDAPLLFQAVKKVFESRRLFGEKKVDELIDSIVYIAAAILYNETIDK